jgi:hypothetical protein
MHIKKMILSMVLFSLVGITGKAQAWTDFYPPTTWGNAPVVALAGEFEGMSGYFVMYKNRTNTQCWYKRISVVSNSVPVLTDNIRVHGGAGNDTIAISGNGSIVCGQTTWTLMRKEMNRVGFAIQAFGGDGNDYIQTWYGIPNNVFGEGGNDTLVGTGEGATLFGGDGNDSLRATNPLFLGSDKNLDGGLGDDCLESNNGVSSQGYFARLYCGAGNDTRSSFGTVSGQIASECETTSAVHCGCFGFKMTCSSGSDCCSGTCSAGLCTATF